ncbi:hypothetical protein [Haploplasma axanthum]|uniref:Uncharacterized protein n=1 Tax=Haploplasma axanthum TaxID=29552 RepID=A0A449BFC9_HAPAX|nr:hypothetical protein [Haploplasma axanthum]VEU81153.1 Uncharacterised protein [Haploplasma axanthum]
MFAFLAQEGYEYVIPLFFILVVIIVILVFLYNRRKRKRSLNIDKKIDLFSISKVNDDYIVKDNLSGTTIVLKTFDDVIEYINTHINEKKD